MVNRNFRGKNDGNISLVLGYENRWWIRRKRFWIKCTFHFQVMLLVDYILVILLILYL